MGPFNSNLWSKEDFQFLKIKFFFVLKEKEVTKILYVHILLQFRGFNEAISKFLYAKNFKDLFSQGKSFLKGNHKNRIDLCMLLSRKVRKKKWQKIQQILEKALESFSEKLSRFPAILESFRPCMWMRFSKLGILAGLVSKTGDFHLNLFCLMESKLTREIFYSSRIKNPNAFLQSNYFLTF